MRHYVEAVLRELTPEQKAEIRACEDVFEYVIFKVCMTNAFTKISLEFSDEAPAFLADDYGHNDFFLEVNEAIYLLERLKQTNNE